MIEIVDNDGNPVAETQDVASAHYALAILVAEERRDLRALDARGNAIAWGIWIDDERAKLVLVQGGAR